MRGGVALLLALAGCAHQGPVRDRGASDLYGGAPLYRAPGFDRCGKFKAGGGPAAACAEARYLAELYVRRLSPGDEVCLEGGFGEAPGAACQTRAAVVDNATGRVMLEVREARPDTRWFQKEQSQYWFEEGALVDLYLAEHGY